MCTFAFLKEGNIQYTKPFLASDYEFQVIREYVREWADEQRLQAVMEFAQPSTSCVYRVPERKGTTMEELVRRMRKGVGEIEKNETDLSNSEDVPL